MLSSGDAGPDGVVFSWEYRVDKGNGRTMLFQVLKRSQTLFVTMQKVPTESTNINKIVNSKPEASIFQSFIIMSEALTLQG